MKQLKVITLYLVDIIHLFYLCLTKGFRCPGEAAVEDASAPEDFLEPAMTSSSEASPDPVEQTTGDDEAPEQEETNIGEETEHMHVNDELTDSDIRQSDDPVVEVDAVKEQEETAGYENTLADNPPETVLNDAAAAEVGDHLGTQDLGYEVASPTEDLRADEDVETVVITADQIDEEE